MDTARRRAFSLIELLVVISIISVLAGLIFPVFVGAKERASSTSCLSNMKQIGIAMMTYVTDYDDAYPMNRFTDASHTLPGDLTGTTRNWRTAIYSYVNSMEVMKCPSNVEGRKFDKVTEESGRFPISYAYNGSIFHEFSKERTGLQPVLERQIKFPTETILLIESRMPDPDLGPWSIPQIYKNDTRRGLFQSHTGRVNILFADQHAKSTRLIETCTNDYWKDSRSDYSAESLKNVIAPAIRMEYK